MKILHTADIHLREYNDERWEALCKIVELGNEKNVDAMMICGDLFDRTVDAIRLKSKVRELFSELSYMIFIIAGNHDSKSFESGSFLGPNVVIINSLDDIHEIGNIRIAGLPFYGIRETEIYERLNHISVRLDSRKQNILLYHGELLNAFYSRDDFGDEGENRYMPVRLDCFNDMNFDYVLAGHFHTNYNIYEFDKKRYFVYPGSPVSITRRETGKRGVNIFRVGEAPREIFLQTHYYEELNIKLDPFVEPDPVTTLNYELDRIDPEAKVLLTVSGYINRVKHGIDETTFNEMIRKISNEKKNIIDMRLEFTDLSRILEDDILKSFMTSLNSRDYDSSKRSEMRELFLKAMMESSV